MILIVMGVSGSGKSTIAKEMGNTLNLEFIDGDDYHSQENKTKMSLGIGLDDQDRFCWMSRLITKLNTLNKDLVLACSCLKLKYRKFFIENLKQKEIKFVYLRAPIDIIKERSLGRINHFVKVSLVESQFKDLEEPDFEEEKGLCVEISDKSPKTIVGFILQKLGLMVR